MSLDDDPSDCMSSLLLFVTIIATSYGKSLKTVPGLNFVVNLDFVNVALSLFVFFSLVAFLFSKFLF